MNLNCKCREVGEVSADVSDSLLSYLTVSDLWGVDVSRQQAYGVHRKTQSVMFRKGDLDDVDFRHSHITCPAWVSNEDALCDMFSALGVESQNVVNMIAVRLPARSNIDPHNDGGPLLSGSHRVHVPLVTHDDVIFMIDRERFNMKIGKAYEINNMLRHSVENDTDIDRIHLIFDHVDPL